MPLGALSIIAVILVVVLFFVLIIASTDEAHVGHEIVYVVLVLAFILGVLTALIALKTIVAT